VSEKKGEEKKKKKKEGKNPHAKPLWDELDWNRRSTATSDQKIKLRPGFPPQYLTLPQPHWYFTFFLLQKARGAPRLFASR